MEAGLALPSAEVFRAIGQALGAPLDYLAGLDDVPPAVRPKPPRWLADLLPDLEALDKTGRDAVVAVLRLAASRVVVFHPTFFFRNNVSVTATCPF